MKPGRLAAVVLMGLSMACAGAPRPARLDAGATSCAQCRRTIEDARLAAQIVVPGEAPVFFDDIQCLAEYLQRHLLMPRDAMAFVADHRTTEWTPASRALYTRNIAVPTPAESHLIAHASAASRDADAASAGGTAVEFRSLFPLGVPNGNR